MELILRPYQEDDVSFLVAHGRVLNANEPGLGKTVESLTARHRLGGGPTLIVGIKSSAGVWQNEAMQWYGEKAIIYTGTPAKRRRKWEQFKREKCTILIVSYKMLKEVKALQSFWQFIIADEIHQGGLLNRRTDAYDYLSQLSSKYMFLITGTPVRKGPQDLWAPLSLLDPKQFGSYWRFINEHCEMIDGPFGQEIGPRPRDAARLRALLSNIMVRHRKCDVLEDLPEKTRSAIPIEMTEAQAKLYKELTDQMYLEIGDKTLFTPNVAALVLRLRQLLVTPQLLGSTIAGGALEALAELVDIEFSAERSVMICTPFRAAVPFIVEALKPLNARIEVIHGQIKELPDTVARRFQALSGYRKILICTIKTGVSFTAHSASTMFMLGCEWSHVLNVQAEDRIHRIGQRHPVNIYYLLHPETVETSVIRRLNRKQEAEDWTLSSEEVLKEILAQRKAR